MGCINFPTWEKVINRNLLDVETVNTKYRPEYAPLYRAVRSGDWEAARKFIHDHPEATTARISIEGKTALHIAALFGHLHVVEELVQLMPVEAIELQDIEELTTLHESTYCKGIEVAKCLVGKSKNLLIIPNEHGLIPVTRALDIDNKEMARYLYSVTPREKLTPEKGHHGATLLNMCYYSLMLDMALDLLKHCPSLAVTRDYYGSTILEALASIPSAFPSGCQLSFWKEWIYNKVHIQIEPESANDDISINKPENSMSQSENTMVHFGRKNIYQIKLAHLQSGELLRVACHKLSELNEEELQTSRVHYAIIRAAERGIPEFIVEVLKVHLHLFWTIEGYNNPLFGAVEFRQARVFNLIHGMIWKDPIANEKDKVYGNTLLHMAGLLAPSSQLHHISGAALQMQRELQWFQEVESIMPPLRKEYLNNDRKTARQLFTENHKDLLKQGEKWMKRTAASYTVVAALIFTIAFAAAFTFPGGNDQNTGHPIFSENKTFMLFILSDAVSLFSSSTSILMIMGILTSRYAEDDFLKRLPTKLIIGLSTLFIPMATLLIAFCAALFVMIPGKAWIVISVSLLACVPVTSFIWLQFPLLVEITMSTYGPSIFDRNVEQWLN